MEDWEEKKKEGGGKGGGDPTPELLSLGVLSTRGTTFYFSYLWENVTSLIECTFCSKQGCCRFLGWVLHINGESERLVKISLLKQGLENNAADAGLRPGIPTAMRSPLQAPHGWPHTLALKCLSRPFELQLMVICGGFIKGENGRKNLSIL